MLGIAAVLRLIVLLAAAGSPQRYWSLDDRDYLGVAHHLHASYVASSGKWFDVGLSRPPAYPLFLRGIFDVFGTHYVAVVAAQLVLSVATVAATYWLAAMLLPHRPALVAAAAVAVDPASIVFSNLMLTETPFALLLTVGLALIVLARRRGMIWLGAVAGLILGVATLTRPVSEYLPLFLVPAIALAPTVMRRSAGLVALAVLVGFVIPTGAWIARNDVKTGVPVLSTIEGYNMLHYRAVGALIEDGLYSSDARGSTEARLRERIHPGDNAAEVNQQRLWLGLTILKEHPWGAVKSWARGEAKLLVGPAKSETAILLTGKTSLSSGLKVLVRLNQLVTIAILLGAAAGTIGLLVGWIRIPSLWILVATAFYLIVVSGGPEAYSRFRVPVTPIFAVLGAAALAEWQTRRVT